MTVRTRRRRAVLMLSLALAAGGLAASQVRGKVREVEGRVGAPVPVVMAATDLRADTRLDPAKARRVLAVRQVPARYAPRDALASIGQAVGAATAVPVAAGSYVTPGQLGGGRGSSPDRRGGPLRRGERAIEVSVAGGDALQQSAAPGSLVDVLVSTEPREGGGRTFLALQSVQLLSLRAGGGVAGGGGGEEGAASAASAVATLRVTLRQAVYLTAAQNYAREVRLVPRPPGDRGRIGRTAVGGGGL